MAIFTLATHVASADVTLRVQSSTQLSLQPQRTADDGVRITGQLRDSLGEPIPEARVRIRVRPPGSARTTLALEGITDARGVYVARDPLPPGEWAIAVSFDGDRHHTASSREAVVGAQQQTLTLAFATPPVVLADDAREHTIDVFVRNGEQPLHDVTVALAADETPLARTASDQDGVARFRLDAAQLPTPAGTLIATTPGNSVRAAARAETSYVRPISPSLELVATRFADSGQTELRGALQGTSEEIAGQAIGVFLADGAHLKTFVTGPEGVFSGTLDDAVLFPEGPGTASIHARFHSSTATLRSTRSRPVEVSLPHPPHPLWLLAALAALGLAARVALRRTPSPTEAGSAIRHTPKAAIETGRARGVPRRHTTIQGVVLERGTTRGLCGVAVQLHVLEMTSRAWSTTTTEHGTFESPALPPGRYRLVLERPGYESLESELELPHRGEWHAVRVHLRSLRELAWDAFSPVVDSAARDADAVPTVRESTTRLGRATGNVSDAEALGAFVERVVYGPDVPETEDIHRIAEGALSAANKRRLLPK